MLIAFKLMKRRTKLHSSFDVLVREPVSMISLRVHPPFFRIVIEAWLGPGSTVQVTGTSVHCTAAFVQDKKYKGFSKFIKEKFYKKI
jgi:hypothetical protein